MKRKHMSCASLIVSGNKYSEIPCKYPHDFDQFTNSFFLFLCRCYLPKGFENEGFCVSISPETVMATVRGNKNWFEIRCVLWNTRRRLTVMSVRVERPEAGMAGLRLNKNVVKWNYSPYTNILKFISNFFLSWNAFMKRVEFGGCNVCGHKLWRRLTVWCK